MPVEHRPPRGRRPGRNRGRHDAVEVGGPGVGAELDGPERPTGRERVEGAFDPPRDLARIGILFDAQHPEARRPSLRDEVGEIGIAEVGEGLVTHRQGPAGVAAVAGNGEVPGEDRRQRPGFDFASASANQRDDKHPKPVPCGSLPRELPGTANNSKRTHRHLIALRMCRDGQAKIGTS